MSKINNLLYLIVKSPVDKNEGLVKTLFTDNEKELISEIKNFKSQLIDTTDAYIISYITLVMDKLLHSIYYYNDGIDGVFNTDTPILEEVINVIKDTYNEAKQLWTKMFEKN